MALLSFSLRSLLYHSCASGLGTAKTICGDKRSRFLQAGRPFYQQANSVKALKGTKAHTSSRSRETSTTGLIRSWSNNWFDQGGHKIWEKNPSFPGFSKSIIILFHRRGYLNKNFGHVAAFKVIFSHIFTTHAQKRHFSWHLLHRVATPWDHNDPVYPVNSCFTQIFDRTKIILFVIIFPRGCTQFPDFSRFREFPSIPDFQVFPGLWPPCSPPYMPACAPWRDVTWCGG